jgi:hypothetical protein
MAALGGLGGVSDTVGGVTGGLGPGSKRGGLNVGGANGISVGPSKNGPIGASANIGGKNGVNADVGAGIGTSKGLASVDVNVPVGGKNGIAAKSNNSVAGSKGLVDSKTTASIGGRNGVNAKVDANIGGRSLAKVDIDIGIGNPLDPGGPGTPGTPGVPGTPGAWRSRQARCSWISREARRSDRGQPEQPQQSGHAQSRAERQTRWPVKQQDHADEKALPRRDGQIRRLRPRTRGTVHGACTLTTTREDRRPAAMRAFRFRS